MMEIERKVKEDFEFYCQFLESHRSFPRKEDDRCVQAWIQKLTNEYYPGIGDQHNRNIYLANLVICIQKLKLEGPFNDYPPENDLSPASTIFGEMSREIKEPLWLNSVINHGGDINTHSKDGRTYFATKAMPDGSGTLGYLAVSLAEGDSNWLDKKSENRVKKNQENTDEDEIHKILSYRRSPEERKKTINFYEKLIEENKKVLYAQGDYQPNEILKDLHIEIIEELKSKGEWSKYESMHQTTRDQELGYLLHTYLKEQKNQLLERELYLDKMEKIILSSPLLKTQRIHNDIYKADREAYANKMWEQAINNGPKKKLLNLLTERYPTILIKQFLILLANDKEKIAIKLQRQHECIVSQLKKELQKENYKGKKKSEDAQFALDEILRILDRFEAASNYVCQMEKKRNEMLRGRFQEDDEVYNEIKNSLKEAQLNVEAEAEAGRWLSDAINSVIGQNERYIKINEENLRKIDTANSLLVKNVKKLSKSISLNDRRLQSITLNCEEKTNSIVENVRKQNQD